MIRMKTIKRVAYIAFALLLLQGCTHSADTPAEQTPVPAAAAPVTISIAAESAPQKIDPVNAEGVARDIAKQLFVSVMRHAPWGGYAEYGGSIAESGDGLGYTVTCREGMYYTDGTPVTIYDLEYYLIHTGMDAQLAVQDEYTMLVRLAEADAGAYVLLAEALFLPRAYYGELYDADASPLGSGPFMWGGAGEYGVTLVANPGFMYGAPGVDAVTWRTADGSMLDMLLNGGADIARFAATEDALLLLDGMGMAYDLHTDGYAKVLISDALDTDVQRAIACVLDRYSAVHAYYHGAAQTPEYYGELPAYSPLDAEGCLGAAGYARPEDAEEGDAMLLDGEPLSFSVYFAGGGTGDSPAYAMLINARNQLSLYGCELMIYDVSEAELTGAAENGADIICTGVGAETPEGYSELPFYAPITVTAYSGRLDMSTVQQADAWCDYTDMLNCIKAAED